MLLITGAGGFLGSRLARLLAGRRDDVRLLFHGPIPTSLPRNAEAVRGDVTSGAGLGKALKDVDTVIHLAGLVSYSKPRDELFRVNAWGTQNLLSRCADVSRFVLASSVAVYGETRKEADESHPLHPRNPYGESKAEAESHVGGSGIPCVMLRMAPVYGAGSPSWRKNLSLLDKGFPIPSTRNLTHVVHADDAVQALAKAASKGSGAYNIADSRPIPFMEFASEIVRLLGRKPRVMPMLLVKMLAAAKGMGPYLDVLSMNRSYAIDKARKELGYKPAADLKAELRRMVEWYRSAS